MHISEKFGKMLEEISRWSNVSEFVEFVEGENPPYKLRVRVYTRDHRYSIVAKEHGDGRSYLGCTVTTRKPRAGETWNRGSDLADGEFSRRVWERIKNDIISYELVKVAKPVRGIPVPENPTGPDKE